MVEGVHGYLYSLGQNRADHRCHRVVQPLPPGFSTRATWGRDLHGHHRRRDSTRVPELRAACGVEPRPRREATSAVLAFELAQQAAIISSISRKEPAPTASLAITLRSCPRCVQLLVIVADPTSADYFTVRISTSPSRRRTWMPTSYACRVSSRSSLASTTEMFVNRIQSTPSGSIARRNQTRRAAASISTPRQAPSSMKAAPAAHA